MQSWFGTFNPERERRKVSPCCTSQITTRFFPWATSVVRPWSLTLASDKATGVFIFLVRRATISATVPRAKFDIRFSVFYPGWVWRGKNPISWLEWFLGAILWLACSDVSTCSYFAFTGRRTYNRGDISFCRILPYDRSLNASRGIVKKSKAWRKVAEVLDSSGRVCG